MEVETLAEMTVVEGELPAVEAGPYLEGEAAGLAGIPEVESRAAARAAARAAVAAVEVAVEAAVVQGAV